MIVGRKQVGAISQILHEAAKDLQTTIVCFQEPQVSSEWYLVLGALAALAVYLYVRNAGTFKAKRF